MTELEYESVISKNVVEHREIGKMQDSLEVGTAGKGGSIKVYGDFNDLDAFKKKIDNAVIARSYANEKLGVNQ